MKKIVRVLFHLLTLTIVIMTVFYPHSEEFQTLAMFKNDLRPFNDGWQLLKSDGTKEDISVPCKIVAPHDKSVVLINKLPLDVKGGDVLATRVYQQSVKVMVDGEEIYDTFALAEKFSGDDLGVYWTNAVLHRSYGDKEISVELYSSSSALHGTVSEFIIGSEGAFFSKLLYERPIFNVLTLTLFLISLLIMVYYIFSGLYQENNAAPYLSLFALILANWYLGQTKLLQFFAVNTYYLLRISNLMTLLCPLALGVYLDKVIVYNKNWHIDLYMLVGVIGSFVMIALEFLKIADLADTLPLAGLFIIFGCFYFSCILFIESKVYNNERAKNELKAIIIFFSFVVVEIIVYFVKGRTEVSYFMLLGSVVYITILIFYSLQDVRNVQMLKNKQEQLEAIAFLNIMTGAFNRTAYARDINNITDPTGYHVILADTDKLKYINDNMGHDFGDCVIRDTYTALSQVANGLGTIYRIGGDEFCLVLKNKTDDEINVYLTAIQEIVEKINGERVYDFSLSVGYAAFDPTLDENLFDVVKRADEDMYMNKSKKN